MSQAVEEAPPTHGRRRRPATRAEEALRAFHEEGALGKAYDSRIIARLWPFVKPYQRYLWISVVSGIVSASFALTRPWLMRVVIDRGAIAKDREMLVLGGVAYGAAIVLEQVLTFLQVYVVQVGGARSMADLRLEVFSFLQGRRLAFFDRQPVGRLVTRVTNDIDTVLELFASGALNALVDLPKLVAIVVVMVSVDLRLSLIGFAAGPVVALLVMLVRRKSREAFRAIRAKTAQMNANMNEQVSGMPVVQAFCREEAAAAEFDVINRDYREANISSIKWEAIQDAAVEMVTSVCLASIVVSLGYRQVSFGTVVAFNAYLLMFFEPIAALSQRYTLLQSAMTGAERVFSLLDLEEVDAPREEDAEPPSASGTTAFSFEDVGFEYKPGVPVLSSVSFSVRRGEKIAVVGPTGAGKTTLSALLLRLYDATSGTVRVEGADVRGMERDALRHQFSVVPQDVFLFPGTVFSNIAIGDPTPDRTRAEQALRRMDALDLFTRRAGGLDAPVTERGENFSAGERQLIAFARALYRNAPILVLDEATANVDSDTESRIQRALDELLRDRTALIIAHRLSTIRAADRILVFKRGKLVEQGTHQELLRAGGLYAKLHSLHFSRHEHAPPSFA